MISLNSAVTQYLSFAPPGLVFVFVHPDDGIAIVVRDPLEGEDPVRYVRVQFPIGPIVLDGLRNCGVLAPLFNAATTIEISEAGSVVTGPESASIDIADLVRAYYFIQSRMEE
jgi:hypothetical protein